MDKDLASAVALAEKLRFSGDKPNVEINDNQQAHQNFDSASSFLAQSGLRISQDLTPSLYTALNQACERISIPAAAIKAYVYASPEVQAHCFSGGSRGCAIRISSGLIQLLSKEELIFVIGHEIGHFLLGHTHARETTEHRNSVECFMQSRSQEISVDRIGLVAGQSLETGIRSLMKTISGLNDSFLRFDVGSFLGQMKSEPGSSSFQDYDATHPSLVMRCRALLWFSMSDAYARSPGRNDGEPLERIDQRIERDLAKYVDGHIREEIAEARKNLNLWLSAAAAIRDGIFERKEQDILSNLVGQETLDKLLGLYRSRNRTQIEQITKRRLTEAFAAYQTLAPKEFSEQSPKVIRQISHLFTQPDFESFVFTFTET
jgi:hypothetical protein